MSKRTGGVFAIAGYLATIGCWQDTSDTIRDYPQPSAENRPLTDILVSARLNDTPVSSTNPGNLNVEFPAAGEPRVEFSISIQPTISVVALADYAFLETREVELDVTQTLRPMGANIILADGPQSAGRLKLELGSQGKVTGTLLDASDHLTLEAVVSFTCAVSDSLLPESDVAAPVPTTPGGEEVLVHDSNFASGECRAARDFMQY